MRPGRFRGAAAGFCGFLFGLAFAVLLLTTVLNALGTNAPMMRHMMETRAPSASTGLPAEEYAGMAEMITAYLSGELDTFQYTLAGADGTSAALFHRYEQAHMADCRSLFVLDRTVLLVSAAVFSVTFFGLILLHRRRAWLTGCLAGLCLPLLAAAVLTVWGLADFRSLFVRFHLLSFSNSLWILNPSTDLLIRLMPTPFFTGYAGILAATWLGGMALAVLFTALSLRKSSHPKERTHP